MPPRCTVTWIYIGSIGSIGSIGWLESELSLISGFEHQFLHHDMYSHIVFLCLLVTSSSISLIPSMETRAPTGHGMKRLYISANFGI